MPKLLPCLALTMLLLAGAGLSACNTAEGVGEDVESGGEVIQDTAGDVKDKVD